MHVTLQYCAKEEGLKQKKISIFSKFHKENNRNNKSVLTFLIFYLLCSSFFYSYFTFIMLKHHNFGKHIWIIRQKTFLKNAHFKISSRDDSIYTSFFSFFHPGRKFHTSLFDRDEFILSRQKRVNRKRHFAIDRDNFIPGFHHV